MSKINFSKLQMSNYLKDLAEGAEPEYKFFGLCTNFSNTFGGYLELMIDFSKYPDYSGTIGYPIAVDDETFKIIWKAAKYRSAYNEVLTNEYAAYILTDGQNKWSGVYGELRRAFCLWCSEEILKTK